MNIQDRVLLGSMAFALAGWLLPIPAALAQPYRWVDGNGVVQFSDRPPAHLSPDQYQGPKPKRASAAPAKQQGEANDGVAPEAGDDQQATDAAGENDPNRVPDHVTVSSRWTCEQARQFHAYFSKAATAGHRFFTANADGSFTPTNPAQKAALAAEWQQAAAKLCQKGIDFKHTGPASIAAKAAAVKEELSIVDQFAAASDDPGTFAPPESEPDDSNAPLPSESAEAQQQEEDSNDVFETQAEDAPSALDTDGDGSVPIQEES